MSPDFPVNDVVGDDDRLVMVVGNYGSGKTEVAVNLAIQLAESGRRVQLADLDIVNPYFRSRETRRLMEAHGIRVVVPPGAQVWADLPIILPEIQGMLHPPPGTVTLFDVGGDDVGARALASFRPAIGDAPYELWQVINSRRPFTGTVEGCLEMQHAIEDASRLKVTGLLANSHLIQHTTARTVLEGWRLALRVARPSGRPVRCVAVMADVADDPALTEIDVPILRMLRYMLPPWLASRRPDTVEADDVPLPAARPVPIGKPRPIEIPRSRGDRHGTNQD
ncbi:MAG: nucleotide-binding protein [Planctomycetota bacterium]|jgi:hypothetical protein